MRNGQQGGRRGYFGNVRKLPSGRFQARYTGPDGRTYTARRNTGGPLTFDTRGDAEAWLTLRHSEVLRNEWLPPAAPKAVPVTLRRYADAWLESRGLEDITQEHHQQLLRDHVYPTFGDSPVTGIAPAAVRTWHAEIGQCIGPTARAHAYALLRTVLNTAVADDLIPANPCRVRGAGPPKRVKKIVPASLPELEVLTTAMPGKYQLMVLLAAWCGLRFGELAEMRRADVDITNGVVHVRRGVVRTKTGRKVKGPKSEAGNRRAPSRSMLLGVHQGRRIALIHLLTDAPGRRPRGIGEESGGERALVDAEDDARTIGRRLRQIGKSRGKSLRVIAGLAGISAASLSRIENGQRALDRHSEPVGK